MSVISKKRAALNTASGGVVEVSSSPDTIRGVRCQVIRDEEGCLRVVLGDQPQASAALSILSDYIEKNELAAELGKNVRTLDRWDAFGAGPPRTRVGRKIYYCRKSVLRWLAAQEHQESVS